MAKAGDFLATKAAIPTSEKTFTDGRCGILLQGANRFPMLKKLSPHPIGVGFMPYWPDICDSPYRLNIGGSSSLGNFRI